MVGCRTSIPVALMLAVGLMVLPAGHAAAWAELGPTPADTDWLFEDDAPDPAERDPLEPLNRGIFGFNEVVYTWVVDPVATVYEWAMPGPGRRAVRRFFSNLSEPVTLVNDLLQIEPTRRPTGAQVLARLGLRGDRQVRAESSPQIISVPGDIVGRSPMSSFSMSTATRIRRSRRSPTMRDCMCKRCIVTFRARTILRLHFCQNICASSWSIFRRGKRMPFMRGEIGLS